MSSGFLLPVVFGLIVSAVLVGGFLLDRRRRERLMTYAVNRGWTYTAEDQRLTERWEGEPFGRGDHRRARNVVTGTEGGQPFVAFDYSFQTHSSDGKGQRQSTTHRWTVCTVPMPGWLGAVQVVPENALHRIAGAVGIGQDIALESEDFNRRYRVTATSPKLASDILTPRTMQYLLSVPAEGWRTCGTDLVGFAQRRLDPAEVVRTTAILRQVLAGVPPFVWKDAGAGGSGYSPSP